MKYSNTHTVYMNEDKVEIPSVTTILKILNKPFLTKWANIMGFKRMNVDDILEESSRIGTLVHQVIRCFLMQGLLVWVGEPADKIRVRNHLAQFNKWYKQRTVEPIFMEREMTSKRYGGTVDFYGIVDEKKTILDFKTSKKVYSTMFLQLSAYCLMLEEQGYVVEQVGIVIINDSKCQSKIITREQLTPYIDTFKLLVELFHNWFDLNINEGWGSILG